MARQYTRRDLDAAYEEGADEAPWLLTYGDMMSLLLTFFVMLYIIIEPSNQDYLGTLRKIGDALGGKSMVERKADVIPVETKLEKFLQDNNLVNQVQMTSDTKGITLWASGDLFFKAGSAELTPDIRFFLKRVGAILAETRYKVVVEGHTDDIPTSSERFPSNWELSAARSSSVVRHFIEDAKLEPARFSAVGRAEFNPRYPPIPENRNRNRRVEIIITREEL